MDNNDNCPKLRLDDEKIHSESNIRVVGDTNTSCGCGPCKPSWIQFFANPKVFTAHCTVIVGLLVCCFAYMGGVLTTIERRFELSSSESGTISIINDVVSLSLALFASYFGHRSHRPRWIGAGTVLCGLGFVLFSMPHFTSDPLDPKVLLYGETQRAPSMCRVDSPSTYGKEYHRGLSSLEDDTNWPNSTDEAKILNSTESSLSLLQPSDMTTNYYTHNNECESSSGALGPIWWIILGNILAGIGASPMYPLITTYIDDAVGKHRLVSYTAFLFMAFSFGPALGFLLSSQTTKLYVDFDRVSAEHIPDIPQHDPRWIGAWWLGFAFLGSFMILIGLPMFLYPKVMINTCPTDSENVNETEEDKEEANTSLTVQDNIFKKHGGQGIVVVIKSLVLAMKRLMTNKTLMLLSLAACAETATIGIFAAFAVKYLQTQFGLSPGTSAMLVGGAIIPCNIISNLASAYICRRFKLNSRQCVIFVIIALTLSGITLPILMAVGCENPEIAGITMPYNSFGEIDPETTSYHLKQNITTTIITKPLTCNAGCSCTTNDYQPVCGSDGITYISACLAGCEDKNLPLIAKKQSQNLTYTNCSCTIGSAKSGQCPSKCFQSKLVTFVVLYAVSFFMMALTGNPLVFVVLRCVDDGDRSVALGLKSVITKILGFFPSPVYFGAIINSTCLYWQYTCGERGACWIYDIVKYRYSYFGTLMVLRTLGLFCYALAYFSIKPEEPKTESADTKHADETVQLKSDNLKKDGSNEADNL